MNSQSPKTMIFIVIYIALKGTPVPAAAEGGDGAQESPVTRPNEWAGHANFLLGYKRMKANWGPAKNQLDAGFIGFDVRKTHWPVSLTGGFSMSYSGNGPPGASQAAQATFLSTSQLSTRIYEFDFGARKVWERWKRVQPFLGAGGAVIVGGGYQETCFIFCSTKVLDRAANFGPWAEAGMYWPVGKDWHLGLRVARSHGDISLFGNRLDAGGTHVIFLIGRRW